MKGLLILVTVFIVIPVILGVISSHRAGVLPHQLRRQQRRNKQ
jgi:preprotein translocase subunit SecG